MVDSDHLDILRQGVNVWNRWREDNPKIKPDLSRITMSTDEPINLLTNEPIEDWSYRSSYVENLHKFNLSGVCLRGTDFTGANLKGANLESADLNEACFNEASLYEANLAYTKLLRADFYAANLIKVNFRGAYLSEARLQRARSHNADLSEADLSKANLSETDFSKAIFRQTTFCGANLDRTNFVGATLYGCEFGTLGGTILFEVNFTDADLTNADLSYKDLKHVNMKNTNLSNTRMRLTIFGDTDLSQVRGLECVTHDGPSTIGIDTIIRSQGNIPEIFLRGAGVPDSFIEYAHSLVTSPIDYYTCFISYSSKDQEFAERLHNDLQSKGVRCWFAPHHMKIGDRIRSRIDESIRLYDKLLLILSQHSVCSQWVEHEVETAIGKELESKPNVLFPIRLDDVVMESKTGWASHIKLTRHTGDFTNWKDYDSYQAAFNGLIQALKAEDK